MTNSMNDMLKKISDTLKPLKMMTPADRQIACIVSPGEVHKALAYLKSSGFTQLSILTCVDWMKENEFELVYVLMNWEDGIHVQLRTRIDREKPVFFGVEFVGNEDSYKPLFLERWDTIPPLRKDFDPRAYSDSKFPMMDRDKVFKSKIGGMSDE